MRRQRPVDEKFVDRLAVDKPHGHVKAAVDLAEIVDRHDMWFVQNGRCLRFPTEPCLILLVVGEVRGKQLQRDDPVHGGVERFPHFPHAAAAQQVYQPVPAERCPVHRLTIRASRVACQRIGYSASVGRPVMMRYDRLSLSRMLSGVSTLTPGSKRPCLSSTSM